jgi:hypothetical protein
MAAAAIGRRGCAAPSHSAIPALGVRAQARTAGVAVPRAATHQAGSIAATTMKRAYPASARNSKSLQRPSTTGPGSSADRGLAARSVTRVTASREAGCRGGCLACERTAPAERSGARVADKGNPLIRHVRVTDHGVVEGYGGERGTLRSRPKPLENNSLSLVHWAKRTRPVYHARGSARPAACFRRSNSIRRPWARRRRS